MKEGSTYGIILLFFMILFAAPAPGDVLPDFRGAPFSDPHFVLNMPDEWRQQPVRYEKWADTADLAVTLDQHLYRALLPLINRFARKHNLKIAVNEGTCGISAGMLMNKAVDIAGFCCPPGEIDRFPDLEYHTVGIGSLAIFVNPANPVDDITFRQAQEVFRGKINTWSELTASDGNPGPDFPVTPAARLHCKLRPGHWRLLLAQEDLFSTRLRTVGSIQDVMLEVYDDTYAIAGMETLYMAHDLYAKNELLKPLKIDGYDPARPDHLISGDYRLYFTYNLTTWSGEGQRKKAAEDLVSYLLKHAPEIEPRFGIVPSHSLREAGWTFRNNELTGEPERNHHLLQ